MNTLRSSLSLPRWIIVATSLCAAKGVAFADDASREIHGSPPVAQADMADPGVLLRFTGGGSYRHSIPRVAIAPASASDEPSARVAPSCHLVHRIVLGVHLREHACPLLVADASHPSNERNTARGAPLIDRLCAWVRSWTAIYSNAGRMG